MGAVRTEDHRPAVRRRSSARASARRARQSVAVASAVLLLGFVWTFADPAAGATTSAGVSLFDDDGGRALFTAADRLGPGRSVSACLTVGAQGARPGDVVRFAATNVSGGLADRLTITLEGGTGGRFGDCTGFTGTRLWTGTLIRLAVDSAGDGLATGWAPDTEPVRSFRVTATVDPALAVQNLTARGDLTWLLLRDAVPVPVPAPVPSGTTATTPEPVPSGSPSPTRTPSATPPAPPASSAPPGGVVPSAAVTWRHRPLPSTPDVVLDAREGWVESVRETVVRAARAAVAVVTRPEYPLAAFLLAGLFLLVQDLIDRRDPKLVAARTRQPEADEVFPDVLVPAGAAPERGSW